MKVSSVAGGGGGGGLHNTTVGTDLNYDPVGEGLVRVHFPYLGVAVPEVELHDLLVDVLLAVYRLPLLGPVDAAMHKTRVVVVEPEQEEWDKRDASVYTYVVHIYCGQNKIYK